VRSWLNSGAWTDWFTGRDMVTIRRYLLQALKGLILLGFSLSLYAQDAGDDLAKLRSGVAGLESDINKLQSSLLFPPMTRVDVFLSVDKDTGFDLQTVNLLVDGDQKAMHIYGADENEAFVLGGSHKVWEGNVGLGKHRLEAKISGQDAKGKPVQGLAKLVFDKTTEGKAVEIIVKPTKDGKSAEFVVKDWGESQ